MRTQLRLFGTIIILLVASTAALAQESSRPPVRAFLTMNLEAGYPLDPFLVSVIGGGNFDASSLAEGCSGFINTFPTVAVNYTGDAEMLQAFFYSEHDPTLIVQLPDGSFLCNDDANELLLDPAIRLSDPPQGTYAVWVGSFSRGQRIPGILVFSADPSVTVGNFDPGTLVNRAVLPTNRISAQTLPAETLLPTSETRGEIDLSAGEAGLILVATQEVTAGGDIPAFTLNLNNDACGGFVSAEPSLVFNWAGTTANLRIFFESETDTTLIVQTPDGAFVCDDDVEKERNFNPLVDILNPAEGTYRVYIGGFDPENTFTGTLTITESVEMLPARLARPS